MIEEELKEVIKSFDFPQTTQSIIKVIGVGGGGGNAVTHMFREGIQDVTFALCNTDYQALLKSEVPVKVQLGKKTTKGLGAGNQPNIAKLAAEESLPELNSLLNDGTQMVFITAGMGGGTGTGAAPIVAKAAKEMDILTVGIVTIPFKFEGKDKIIQALKGVVEIRKNVDALLVINNERLIDIYGNMDLPEGLKKADSTLRTAAKGIAEIITLPGYINLDFADVNTTLKNGGVAIMNSGYGSGENRVSAAFEDALNSPLLNNNDVFNAKKILFNVYFTSTKPLKMDEMTDVNNFMARFNVKEIKVIWGTALDDTLEEGQVKVTVLATGFGVENIPMIDEILAVQQGISAEELKKQEEEDAKEREYENQLIKEFYGEEIATTIGKSSRPRPFIFTSVELMDDNGTIEALINHPAYNRSNRIMATIAQKAKEKMNDYEPSNTSDKQINFTKK
jgi:cell division protein FtsZ